MSTYVVGVDGSDLAQQAAGAGLAILQPADTTWVVMVVDDIAVTVGADVSGFAGPVATPDQIDEQRRSMLEEGEQIVAAGAAALDVPDGARTKVLEGSAAQELCRFAEEVGADAIVVGSSGKGGVKRALLGSVSDHVVRNAHCPVVVTRPDGG